MIGMSFVLHLLDDSVNCFSVFDASLLWYLVTRPALSTGFWRPHLKLAGGGTQVNEMGTAISPVQRAWCQDLKPATEL